MLTSAAAVPGRAEIVLLEPDPELADALAAAFGREGWLCRREPSLGAARSRLLDGTPRVAVLDLDAAPAALDLAREAASLPWVRLIAVSSRAGEADRVVALEVGADDFLPKPFSTRELVARVRALQRRMGGGAAARPAAPPAAEPAPGGRPLGPLVADPRRLRVRNAAGGERRLTGAEAGLLDLLLRAPAGEATRDEIALAALGRPLLPLQRGVDQVACGLRRKLAELSGGAVELVAVRGRGFRLVG